MALVRRNDEHLHVFAAEPERHELHCKCFPRTGRPQDRDVGILVNPGIEDIHDDQGIVRLVDPHQDPVLIRHLIGRERVAACHPGGQDVPFRLLIELPVQV